MGNEDLAVIQRHILRWNTGGKGPQGSRQGTRHCWLGEGLRGDASVPSGGERFALATLRLLLLYLLFTVLRSAPSCTDEGSFSFPRCIGCCRSCWRKALTQAPACLLLFTPRYRLNSMT